MKLTGVYAPVPTPFSADGAVDLDRFAGAMARWVASPLTGFVVLGSTGEAVFLDEDETDRVVAAARDAIPRGRPMIVGTGRESTRAAIDATRRAARLGADAALVRTPGFFKSQMTTDAFVRHYTAVADASPVPVLLYNFTAVTGVNLLPAAAARLSEHPNIIGMKESGGDIAHIAEIVNSTPDDFQLLAGSATTFFAALSVGTIGGILALSCLLPEACVRLFELTTAGHVEQARALQRRIAPLAKLMGPVFGVTGLKAALHLAGYDVGVPRSPLAPAPGAAIAQIREALDAFMRAEPSRGPSGVALG